MKFYIIAGEMSGDLHGANLIKALKSKYKSLSVRAWGGEKMKDEGAVIDKHINHLAFMGFVEVFLNLRTILKNFSACKESILSFDPDAVILIDYPGFNLRMAKWLKKKGYKVIYYISPQLWAWNPGRAKTIKKYVDLMICILPFEPAFYKNWGVDASFVGHPLVEITENLSIDESFLFATGIHKTNKVTALLPGSRKQEIKRHLPLMVKLAEKHPDQFFIVAGVRSIEDSYYKKYLNSNSANIKLVKDLTYQILSRADKAIVGSGTATLETALLGVPQVVIYKASSISFAIAKRLVKVKYISLVNLILGKMVVAELIQSKANLNSLYEEFQNLDKERYLSTIEEGYQELRTVLGSEIASVNASRLIVETLSKS